MKIGFIGLGNVGGKLSEIRFTCRTQSSAYPYENPALEARACLTNWQQNEQPQPDRTYRHA